MDITYSYTKIRKNFGRQPLFCESPVQLLDSIDPNVPEQKKYILRNPVHREAQVGKVQSEHYINTKRVVMTDSGANHGEGGWPKDVNFWDEEATLRVRRRWERDDDYVHAVLSLYNDFEHCVKQNNAVELYEMYFRTMKAEKALEKSSIRLNNVYKDPYERPVSCINFTCEDDAKMVVSYCNRKYPIPIIGPSNKNFTCYLWDLENPHAPYMEFEPPNPVWQFVCSPVSPAVIIAGLNDGRVCAFDVRASKEPQLYSPMHLAHRDPVSSLLFIFSRTNSEFFSASSDGRCMWWDLRDLSQPTDTLMMTIRVPPGETPSLAYAEGVSVLQFERTIPTKFLCGTDTGFVISVNRKGKTINETMSAVFNAHRGQVKALHRSPCIVKMFITCGDWTINLWSDDVHISPIITGCPQRHQINDVVWSPQRNSSFMSITSDGWYHYWDILRKVHEPIISMPVSKYPLMKVKTNEEGKLVSMGDSKGVMYLYGLSDNLIYSGEKDKQLLTAMFERETKREHILESRIKEILLKRKAEEEGVTTVVEEYIDEDALAKTAEDEYRKTVIDEIKRTGYVPGASSKAAPPKGAPKKK